MELISGEGVQHAINTNTYIHIHTQIPALILYPKITGTFDGLKEPDLIFLPVLVLGHP